MKSRQDMIDLKNSIEKVGMKARGRAEMFKHLDGGELTRGAAIKAKCYDCMGWYSDGKMDCLQPDCPLYSFMPYKGTKEGE